MLSKLNLDILNDILQIYINNTTCKKNFFLNLVSKEIKNLIKNKIHTIKNLKCLILKKNLFCYYHDLKDIKYLQ